MPRRLPPSEPRLLLPFAGATATRSCGFALTVLATLAFGCAPAPEATIIAQLGFPFDALPLSTIEVTVTAPVQSLSEPQLVAVGSSSVQVDGSRQGDVWLGSARLTLPETLGDQLVTFRAETESGDPVLGYAVVHVTPQGPCSEPTRQAREGLGDCVEVETGPPLATPSYFRTSTPDRSMLHPKSVVVAPNGSLIACITDSVAVIEPEQLFPLSSVPLVDGAVEGEEDPFPTSFPRAEALMEDVAGLPYCGDLAVDLDREAAISTTYASSGRPGGLVAWSLPGIDTVGPATAPQLTDRVTDPDGFAGLARNGDLYYIAHRPDRLGVWRLDPAGLLQEVTEVVLPGCESAWSVARDRDVLYVTDGAPRSEPGESGGGQVFALDLTDPSAPVVRDVITLAGLPKSIAVLPDDVIAVASGQTGIELVDVSDPEALVQLETIDTPGSATVLAYDGGYLMVSDWTTLRLYDVPRRGALRLLWATDLAYAEITPPFPLNPYAVDNAQFVGLQGDIWIGSDMDSIWVGQLQRGRRDATPNLVDRRVAVNARGCPPERGAHRPNLERWTDPVERDAGS